MTPVPEPFGTPGVPPLSELLARYLERQTAAHGDGLAAPEAQGEVVPFEAAPVQPVDPRVAWDEAVRAASFFHPSAEPRSWQPPADWPALVAAPESATALAFSLGNFPQLVRDLQPLWRARNLSELQPAAGRPVAAPALLDWAAQAARKHQYPQTLLALGCLRLARQIDLAGQLLRDHEADVPAEWRAAWANERAALSWHQGRCREAAALWQSQADSVPVLFNRGMSALFLNQPAEARPWLAQAVAQISEDDGWHHLGRLYLALAEMQG